MVDHHIDSCAYYQRTCDAAQGSGTLVGFGGAHVWSRYRAFAVERPAKLAAAYLGLVRPAAPSMPKTGYYLSELDH